MQAEIEKLTDMITVVLAAQAQTSVPQPANTSLDQPNTSAIPFQQCFLVVLNTLCLKVIFGACILTSVKDFAHMSPRVLQAMTQKDKESFKEYTPRWRQIVAQVRPPLEENELTKIFLKTVDQFYYKKMVASAPNNFVEMVAMGMRLEEGVREGHLVKKGFPTDNSEEKDREVSMEKGQPQQQAPHQFNPQYRAQKAPQYDLIPIKYAELLPYLLEKNLVQTRPPPLVPKKFPARWRPDLFCAFHQGAQVHDVEHYFSLKIEVQKLIEANVLPYKN